jgi:hypothetical protein
MISGYYSGTYNNFEHRLHCRVSGLSDLALFYQEGSLYTGVNAIIYVTTTGGILSTGSGSLTKNLKNHWSRQFFQKCEELNFPTGKYVFP